MQLKDFETLADAQAYSTTQPKLIHRDTMNSLLASAGLYVQFKTMAEDSANPFQNLIAAFLDSVEYNFMIGNATGDRQILALDTMIEAGGDLGAALATLKPVIIGIANPAFNPFVNATSHDFAKAKGIMVYKPIPDSQIDSNGYLAIDVDVSLNADFVSHAPQIHIETHGIKQRVAGFQTISKSGKYIAFVNRNRGLFVDDFYGVISNG